MYPYHAYTSSTRHSQGTVRSRINLLHAQREGNIRRINHSHAFLSPINIDIPKLPCISAPPLVDHAVDSIDEPSVTNRTVTGRVRHHSNRVTQQDQILSIGLAEVLRARRQSRRPGSPQPKCRTNRVEMRRNSALDLSARLTLTYLQSQAYFKIPAPTNRESGLDITHLNTLACLQYPANGVEDEAGVYLDILGVGNQREINAYR